MYSVLINLTPYSILTVTVVTCVFMVLFILVTQIRAVISKVPMWITMSLAFIMCLRLLFPVEFLCYSKTLLSFSIFPHIDNVFYADISAINNIAPDIKLTVVNVFCCVWIAGAVVFIVNYLRKYNKLCKTIKCIDPADDPLITDILNNIKAEHNFKFDVKIIVNSAVPSPSEFGFFRQIIFLNNYKYTAEELNYILLHELTHFYNKSNWIKLFMDMVKSILWWNPLVYILQKHIDNLLEIYVDTYVVRDSAAEYRLGYLECICSVFKRSIPLNMLSAESSYVHSMASVSNRSVLKMRYNVICLDHRNSMIVCASAFLLILIYMLISGRYVVQPGYEPDEDDMYIPQFTSENSYIVKEGDMYVLYCDGTSYLVSPDLESLPDVPFINE